jgi:hypothetical protein
VAALARVYVAAAKILAMAEEDPPTKCRLSRRGDL